MGTLCGIVTGVSGMQHYGITASNQNKSQHDEHRRQTRECRMHSRLSRLFCRACSPAKSSYAGFHFDEAAVTPQKTHPKESCHDSAQLGFNQSEETFHIPEEALAGAAYL